MKLTGRQLSIFILVTLLVTTCKPTENNGIIDNGIYEVKFNSFDDRPSVYEDYKLTINGTDYTKLFKDGQIEEGKVEKLYTHKFRLTDTNEKKIPQDSLTDFQKSLQNWGPPCFELTGKNRDTIKFRTTFSGQLHINLNTGVLIKMR